MKRLETFLGLPPLETVMSLLQGETGKRADRILGRLERLSKDSQGIGQAVELLKLVERLDQQGTLARLLELLKELPKSKDMVPLLERFEKFAPFLEKLLKEA